jgi:hypothetical protein
MQCDAADDAVAAAGATAALPCVVWRLQNNAAPKAGTRDIFHARKMDECTCTLLSRDSRSEDEGNSTHHTSKAA